MRRTEHLSWHLNKAYTIEAVPFAFLVCQYQGQIITHKDDFSDIFDYLSYYCELCVSRAGKGGAYFAVPKDDEYG